MDKAMKIICNKRHTCRERHHCGGARPHSHAGCEPCPFDSSAKCEEYDPNSVQIVTQAGARKLLTDLGYDVISTGVGTRVIVPRSDADCVIELINEVGFKARIK